MKWFRDRSTSVKLMSGFGPVGLIVAAVGWIAVYNMGTINTNVAKVYEGEMLPSLVLANMRSLTHESRSDMYHALASKDAGEIKAKMDKARECEKQIEQLWAEYEPKIHTEKGRAAFKKYKEAAQLYSRLREDKIFKPLSAGQHDTAWAACAEIRPTFYAFLDALDGVIEVKKDVAKERYADCAAIYASSRTTAITLAVGGMVLGLGLGWGISRLISKPLNQSVGVLQAVAAGDLTKRLDVDTKDEIGQMASALNTAIDQLRSAEEAKA
ncbi:MAG TPA: MCP four helix bundle domain-containing protein, partial [Gemmataceae bacterium]|nr:MCP four helix bundle domain-containing protein [Gemmataceae bacterium]